MNESTSTQEENHIQSSSDKDKDKHYLYIQNNIPLPSISQSSSYIKQSKLLIYDQLVLLIDKLNIQYPSDSEYRTLSNKEQMIDPSIYYGTGGNIYAYWRLLVLNSKTDSFPNGKHHFEKAIFKNYSIFKSNCEKKMCKFVSPSFLIGPLGTLSFLIIYNIMILNYESLNNYMECIINLNNLCYVKTTEQDLLYGYTGYLWGILFLLKQISVHNVKNHINKYKTLSLIVKNLVFHISNEGKTYKLKYNNPFLTFFFPNDDENSLKSEGDFYLGVLNGILGTYYVLLEGIIFLREEYNDITNELNEVSMNIEESLDYILTFQQEDGNFPIKFERKVNDFVQFCHGAPGIIYVYLKAYSYYMKLDYLFAAIKMGEIIWKKGILKKGNSICHGISGNAYALYALYKYTSNDEWLMRSYCFVLLTFNPDVQRECNEYDDNKRLVIGKSNNPYSLMEGVLGNVCLYSDFLSDDIIFPGFEIGI